MHRLPILLALALGLLASPPASAVAARRVAVLYFENSGNPELEMLRLGLAEMLISDLAGSPGIEVVERGRINDLLGELDLQKTDKVDQGTAVQMGKLLGVERVVVGSYFALMGQFQLMGRVIDVQTGVVLGADQQNGQVAEFMVLQDRLSEGLLPFLAEPGGLAPVDSPKGGNPPGGGRVRGKEEQGASQGTPAAEPSVESADRAWHPAQADRAAATTGDPLGAALAFSEGLDYLDRKDIKRAREAMQRAVDLDPSLDAARDELARISI